MAKSAPIPPEQLSGEVRKLFDVLNNEGDLPAVLISISFLDAALATLLELNLVKGSTTERLLSPRGAVGTFAAKSELAYAMGLIPKAWLQDLATLGELRNLFAHHRLALSFEDDQAFELAEKLHAYNWGDNEFHGRNRFTLAVVMLANMLIMEGLSRKQKPAKISPLDARVETAVVVPASEEK